jgi:hypothetical protein
MPPRRGTLPRVALPVSCLHQPRSLGAALSRPDQPTAHVACGQGIVFAQQPGKLIDFVPADPDDEHARVAYRRPRGLRGCSVTVPGVSHGLCGSRDRQALIRARLARHGG